jgi:hypothetical protein
MTVGDIGLLLLVVIGGGWALWRSQVDIAAYFENSTKGRE